jgi:hypothetical protein
MVEKKRAVSRLGRRSVTRAVPGFGWTRHALKRLSILGSFCQSYTYKVRIPTIAIRARRAGVGTLLRVSSLDSAAYEFANLVGRNKILRDVLRTRRRSGCKLGAHDAEQTFAHRIEYA